MEGHQWIQNSQQNMFVVSIQVNQKEHNNMTVILIFEWVFVVLGNWAHQENPADLMDYV